MFSKEGPYPGVSDITIHNFDMIQEGRIVVFYGKYFNEFSGNILKFRTRFTFSIAAHILKVETIVSIDGIQTVVGRRIMMRPDNEYRAFIGTS